MKIAPAQRICGTIMPPGDKSISHRAAMIAALADGTTRIRNYSDGADCAATLECLAELGVGVKPDGNQVLIRGVGPSGLHKSAAPLDCRNSGTTMRLLAGILAGQPFDSVLTGDSSLTERPMRRIIEPLEMMGASVTCDNGHAPLEIAGRRPLSPIRYSSPVTSAQVKSCVLLAGLFADGVTSFAEKAATRDHTERLLEWFGADISVDGLTVSVTGNGSLDPRDVDVPGDISAAAYFMVVAACLQGSDLIATAVGMNPARVAVIDLLKNAGANVEVSGLRDVCNEPVADIRVRGGLGENVQTLVIEGAQTAALIDELPVLAVLGTQLEGGIEVRDAGELRIKESDRIAAIVGNLKAMGASIEEHDDGFRVDRSSIRGATVASFGDHRIAMSMAIAGLLADGETHILGADCVDVSFPGFFEMMERCRKLVPI